MKRKCGLTLIEVLVVVAVVALLIAILTPSFQKVKEKAGLISCASNQSQIVKAVSVYAVEYDDRLPLPVTTTGTPDVLWRADDVGSSRPTSDAYSSLGSYLPKSDIYNCPLSSFASNDYHKGRSYQNHYKNPYNGDVDQLYSGYQLLWSYNSFNPFLTMGRRDALPRPFSPGGGSYYNNLLICEAMGFTGQRIDMGMEPDSWFSPHRFEGASKSKGKGHPFYLRNNGLIKDINTDPELRQIRLNAGYLDGRVERYVAGDTFKAQYKGRGATVLLPKIWQ